MHVLERNYTKIGYFKVFSEQESKISAIDPSVTLINSACSLKCGSGLPLSEAHAIAEAERGFSKVRELVMDSYKKFLEADKYDMVVIEGARDVFPAELANSKLHSDLARIMNSNMVLIVNASPDTQKDSEKSLKPEEMIEPHAPSPKDIIVMCKEATTSFEKMEAPLAGLIIQNIRGGRQALNDMIDTTSKLSRKELLPVLATLPVDPMLISLRMTDVAQQLGGQILSGAHGLQNHVHLEDVKVVTTKLWSWLRQVRTRPSRVVLERRNDYLRAFRDMVNGDPFGALSVKNAVKLMRDVGVGDPNAAKFDVDAVDIPDVVTGKKSEPGSLSKEQILMYAAKRMDLDHDGIITVRDVEDFVPSIVVVSAADRVDIVAGMLLSDIAASVGQASLSGIILTGGYQRSEEVRVLLADLEPALLRSGMPMPPVIVVEQDTFATVNQLSGIKPRITPQNFRKIQRARQMFDDFSNKKAITQAVGASTVSADMSPKKFLHNFIEKARQSQRRIVLPEGDEPRMIQAADYVLKMQTAQITLLGDLKEIEGLAKKLQVDLSRATIIDPATNTELRQKYADAFFEKRKSKGMTKEGAWDQVLDVNYFGTMMVSCGDADGMVSGSVHTTADTVRPALQIIKTKPGINIVSSVFFMALEKEVLVYGDCAINPNPTSEELAQIAITSADTAEAFGIHPRIAMLSYQTGSPKESDAVVAKVAKATELVKKLAPNLEVTGPIQYDAAYDAAVAKKKDIGDDKVAGRANVFIFPDLSSGNNTYKAVQQSSGSLAMGPLLQGLNKPVNDLSRGATVLDIANTIAMTACLVK